MKSPKPWYWKARNAWYVQLNGKQIRLHEDEAEALREFYRVMAAAGRLDERQAGPILVADAIETLCASIDHHRLSTRRLYVGNLGPIAAAFRNRRLDQVRPDEYIRFITAYQGRSQSRSYGDASRSLMFRYIKTLYRWARDVGLIAMNPLHGTDNPWKVTPRPRVMTDAEYQAVMADPKVNRQFKEIMEFLWRTGARPGEIATLSARHLDAREPVARLQPTEHKTGTKTGLQRTLVFPPDLMARLRGYALLRPRGALLVNTRGHRWDAAQICKCFSRVKRRLGLTDVVIYMARHAFITRLLAEGQSPALVAKIVGHTHSETIQRVYYHPDQDAMVTMVTDHDAGEGPKVAAIQERAADARRDHLRQSRAIRDRRYKAAHRATRAASPDVALQVLEGPPAGGGPAVPPALQEGQQVGAPHAEAPPA